MGHFETFQRYLFAGIFEYSNLLADFDPEGFFRRLNKECSLEINPVGLAAYRGFGATVGILLANNLPGWHKPDRVNRYFRCFGFDTQFFSNEDCRRLNLLWQLRHSIVHTGGSITLPDAQKIDELKPFGNKPIVFDEHFVFEISRKMHPLVKDATGRLKSCFRNQLSQSIDKKDESQINSLFEVKSSVGVWLR